MPITNYPDYMQPAGKAGQLSSYQDYTADTYAVEQTVPFGAAVQLNATGTAIKPIATGGAVVGIALAQNIHDWVEKKNDQNYPFEESLSPHPVRASEKISDALKMSFFIYYLLLVWIVLIKVYQ